MFLFIILALILIILTVIVITTISALGAGVIVIFGDVIVCAGVIIYIIVRRINKHRK